VVSHSLFLQNLSPYTHGFINGVTWSLALEMQFYVALVFSVGWLVRLGAGKTLLMLTTIAWAWRFGTAVVLPPGQSIPHLQVIYTTQLPGTLDEFGVGIALALVVNNSKHWLAPLLVPRWRNFLGWLIFSSLCLTVAGSIFLQHGNYWAHFGMAVFWRTLLAAGFGAALTAMIVCPLKASGLLKPWRYLGTISYGLYLWHLPVLVSLLTLPGPRGGRLFVVLLSASVVLASLSWHLMEKHWIYQRHGSKADG
jgi:peptidoglycan/LPS O-acetylase OafA/YrhL